MRTSSSTTSTKAEARDIRGRLRRIQFADGAKTAGVFARAVKRNAQAEAGPDTAKLQEAATGTHSSATRCSRWRPGPRR